MDSGLSMVVLLFSSREGEVDLLERWVEDLTRELLQVALEGMAMEQLKDRSHKEGEDGMKQEAKAAR